MYQAGFENDKPATSGEHFPKVSPGNETNHGAFTYLLDANTV